jgi:membrane protein YqaA with SNARE-associated domain
MFQRLYHWTLSLAESPHAPWALGIIAFAESSFFPIPPDVILVPMCLARPRRAWAYAALCTVASVAGGALGYAIGALLFDTVGHWLISVYGYAQKIETVRQFYQDWGAAFILVKGLTPIPFKLVTIVSGLLGYNFALFLLLALITAARDFSSSRRSSTISASRSRRCSRKISDCSWGCSCFLLFLGSGLPIGLRDEEYARSDHLISAPIEI